VFVFVEGGGREEKKGWKEREKDAKNKTEKFKTLNSHSGP
jgi:hypothetical protein